MNTLSWCQSKAVVTILEIPGFSDHFLLPECSPSKEVLTKPKEKVWKEKHLLAGHRLAQRENKKVTYKAELELL